MESNREKTLHHYICVQLLLNYSLSWFWNCPWRRNIMTAPLQFHFLYYILWLGRSRSKFYVVNVYRFIATFIVISGCRFFKFWLINQCLESIIRRSSSWWCSPSAPRPKMSLCEHTGCRLSGDSQTPNKTFFHSTNKQNGLLAWINIRLMFHFSSERVLKHLPLLFPFAFHTCFFLTRNKTKVATFSFLVTQ